MTLLLFVGIGSVIGLLVGYLGIGGGIVMVPLFIEIFLRQGLSVDSAMTSAFASSLFVAMFTTASSAIKQWQQDNLIVELIPMLALGAIAGAQIGSYLGSTLAGALLMQMFGVFLIIVSVMMIFNNKRVQGNSIPKINKIVLLLTGIVTGIFAGMFGLGGGVLMVPALILMLKIPSAKVSGTSSAVACLIAFSGVIGYALYGVGRAEGGAGFWGIVRPEFTIPMAIGSTLTSPIGAVMNKRFGGEIYRRIFALLLVYVALQMLWRNVG